VVAYLVAPLAGGVVVWLGYSVLVVWVVVWVVFGVGGLLLGRGVLFGLWLAG